MKINKKSAIFIIGSLFVALTLVNLLFDKSQENVMLEEAKKVFEENVKLANNFDPSVFSLFSDDAILYLEQVNTDTGVSYPMKIPVNQLKPLAASLMEEAKKINDSYIVSNVEYFLEGNHVKVTATTYSLAKCFTNKEYYAIIKKIGESYKITEDHNKISILSQCEDVKYNMESVLKERSEILAGLVPFQIDEHTWLVNASAEGKILTQVLQIDDSLGLNELNANHRTAYLETVCDNPDTKTILDIGGELKIIFQNKSGTTFGEIDISNESCKL